MKLRILVFSIVLWTLIPALGLWTSPNKTQGEFFEYIVCPAGPGNLRNTEASFVTLKDGRWLMAWSDFYTTNSSDFAPARISAMYSKDGGRSWTDKFTLQENIGKKNVYVPELLRLKSGKILFLFWVGHSEADAQVMSRISNDDAKTWSDPKPLPLNPSPAYWLNQHDTVIQLKSGRILDPFYFTEDWRTNKFVRIRAHYSDDEARTWKPSRTLLSVEGKITSEEPSVVELKDGSVLMLIRNGTQRIYKSYSRDQGETWSNPVPTELTAASRSPVRVRRIPSTGDLVVVWNNSPDKRCPLTVALSQDEGNTWKHTKNLEQDPRFTYAYTTINFIDQRAMFTYWVGDAPKGAPSEKNNTITKYSLKLKSVPVKWLYE